MQPMFQWNFVLFCIVVLFVVLCFSKGVRDEGFEVEKQEATQKAKEAFGMSPGTMDQLASTRVVSKKEQELENTIYDNLTRQGIDNMTETGYQGTDYASTAFE
jgi:hypothetical protein